MKKMLAVAALASAVVASPAYAAHELPPGDFNSPFAGSSPYSLTATGALLADTGLQNVGMTMAGTTLNTQMRAAVYNAGNGFLDFFYQITNLGSSTTAVEELSFANFTGFEVVGAWQQLAAFGVFAAGVEEADSAERNFSGDALGVAFDSNAFADVNAGANQLLNPGETSAIFQFRVAATNFRPGTFTAQNGIAVTGAGFAPAAAVPEPGTWAMMLIGFGAVGFSMRRGRRVKAVPQIA